MKNTTVKFIGIMHIETTIETEYNLIDERGDYVDKKDIDGLNSIYKELAVEFGVDTAYKMYEQYGGLQIVFPNKFESAQHIKEKIIEEHKNGEKVQVLAKKYGYSERYLRKLLKDNNTET